MVYRGPSQGCGTCQARHIKCDRTTPACSNCTIAHHDCPGYKDFFEVMWRDQTHVVPVKTEREREVRATRRHIKRVAEKATPQTLSPASTAVSLQRFRSDFRTETECLAFFWYHWKTVTADLGVQTREFEEILLLHSQTEPLSPLGLAVTALAVNITYSSHGCCLDSGLPCSLLVKALAVTQTTLNDPVARLTDETLMTVMLLGVCDVLNRKARSQAPSGIHKDGILALVEARGASNFSTKLSKRLLVAVRHHLIRLALLKDEEVPTDTVLWTNESALCGGPAANLETYTARLAGLKARLKQLSRSRVSTGYYVFPPAPLHLLLLNTSPWLAQDLKVESDPEAKLTMRQASRSHNHSKPLGQLDCQLSDCQSLQSDALALEALLTKWPTLVPPAWCPVAVSADQYSNPCIGNTDCYRQSCDIYPSMKIAGLWNWHRSLHLAVIRIVLMCQQMMGPDRESAEDALLHLSIVETVQSLVDAFCDSVPFHLNNHKLKSNLEKLDSLSLPCHQSRSALAASMTEETLENDSCGAWYLLGPLTEIMMITKLMPLASASCTPKSNLGEILCPLIALRPDQREWLVMQEKRIRRTTMERRKTRTPDKEYDVG